MPKRPCPTCRQIFEDGNCPRHPKRGGYRPNRPSVRDGAYGRLWRRVRDRAVAAAGARCAYCSSEGRTGDHVVPRTKGGRTEDRNTVCACSRCNTSKGDRTLTEWVHSGTAPAQAASLLAARIMDQLPV